MSDFTPKLGSVVKPYVAQNDATKLVPQKLYVPKKGEKVLTPLGQLVASAKAGISSNAYLFGHGSTMTDSQATVLRKTNQTDAEAQMKNVSCFTYPNK